MHHPETFADPEVVEELHGRRVPDPYRWLEDPDSAETRAWVRAQNEVTESYLAELPARDWFTRQLTDIIHRPRAGTPVVKAGRWYVNRNDGQQNQDVWFGAGSLAELEAGGSVVIDPNLLSADQTSSVQGFTVNGDGTRLAYARSDAGSDWAHFVVVDPVTGDRVDDAPVTSKFSVPEWLPDDSYLYLGWPGAERTEGTATAASGRKQLRRHRTGRPGDQDEVVLEFPDEPRLMFWAEVSHDDRLVVVPIEIGTENSNRVWVHRLRTEGDTLTLSDPIRLIDENTAQWRFVRADGDRLIMQTDTDAPRGRVVAVDLAAFEATGELVVTELIPQGEDVISDTVAAGDGLLVLRLVDAQAVIDRYALDGTHLGRLDLPAGAVMAVNAKPDHPDAFVGISTVTSPTTAVHVDTRTGATRVLDLVPGETTYTPPEVVIERRRATSADGTAVPYFLVSRVGHDLSTPAPALMWGYGGFKIPMELDYRPGWSAWLAAGGVLAVANLRGGGEYGTEWYDAGRLGAKQNVFDDFIAVGEDLCARGVTSPAQLAVHGRSNGGLLVGAVLTQRPDLFAAAVPAVGVHDLLRFHKFTIGAAWVSDFGDPDVAADFEVIMGYSPLHNVRPGTAYPPTLVLTGDHDDRVVPLHSHKLTAALQHAQGGDAPVLTRVEVDTGHGMGKPSAMVATEWADWLAFVAFHTGLPTRPDTGPLDRSSS